MPVPDWLCGSPAEGGGGRAGSDPGWNQGVPDLRDPPERLGIGRAGREREGEPVQGEPRRPGYLRQVHHQRRSRLQGERLLSTGRSRGGLQRTGTQTNQGRMLAVERNRGNQLNGWVAAVCTTFLVKQGNRYQFMFVFFSAGRSSPRQRPADCRQRGVSAGEDQPGRHGNAAQVHVHGGQQARDDPADRGQTRVQEERGEE